VRLRQRQSGYELQADPDLIGWSMASGTLPWCDALCFLVKTDGHIGS